MGRTMPSTKAAMRATVPVDTSGMDPEMASTIGGESARIMKSKAMYAPKSLGKPAASGVKKQGLLDRIIAKVRGK